MYTDSERALARTAVQLHSGDDLQVAANLPGELSRANRKNPIIRHEFFETLASVGCLIAVVFPADLELGGWDTGSNCKDNHEHDGRLLYRVAPNQ